MYVAFVPDLYSRRVVGRVSNSRRTDRGLDALEQGRWQRQQDQHEVNGLVQHSDRPGQYIAIRYGGRLAEAGIVASVGSKGDSNDNAAAVLGWLHRTTATS